MKLGEAMRWVRLWRPEVLAGLLLTLPLVVTACGLLAARAWAAWTGEVVPSRAWAFLALACAPCAPAALRVRRAVGSRRRRVARLRASRTPSGPPGPQGAVLLAFGLLAVPHALFLWWSAFLFGHWPAKLLLAACATSASLWSVVLVLSASAWQRDRLGAWPEPSWQASGLGGAAVFTSFLTVLPAAVPLPADDNLPGPAGAVLTTVGVLLGLGLGGLLLFSLLPQAWRTWSASLAAPTVRLRGGRVLLCARSEAGEPGWRRLRSDEAARVVHGNAERTGRDDMVELELEDGEVLLLADRDESRASALRLHELLLPDRSAGRLGLPEPERWTTMTWRRYFLFVQGLSLVYCGFPSLLLAEDVGAAFPVRALGLSFLTAVALGFAFDLLARRGPSPWYSPLSSRSLMLHAFLPLLALAPAWLAVGPSLAPLAAGLAAGGFLAGRFLVGTRLSPWSEAREEPARPRLAARAAP